MLNIGFTGYVLKLANTGHNITFPNNTDKKRLIR